MEASDDLADWRPLATLVRINASTNALIYIDTNAGAFPQRFYRLRTNLLITALPQPTGPFPVEGRRAALQQDSIELVKDKWVS